MTSCLFLEVLSLMFYYRLRLRKNIQVSHSFDSQVTQTAVTTTATVVRTALQRHNYRAQRTTTTALTWFLGTKGCMGPASGLRPWRYPWGWRLTRSPCQGSAALAGDHISSRRTGSNPANRKLSYSCNDYYVILHSDI